MMKEVFMWAIYVAIGFKNSERPTNKYKGTYSLTNNRSCRHHHACHYVNS
jgi:hypothetical protein